MSRQVYTIPADLPFSDVLARVLLGRYRHQPMMLSEVQIFLPTRRATRNLSHSFLKESQGKALLLPRFHTLGDLDDEDRAEADLSETSAFDNQALAELSENRVPWVDAHRQLIAMQMLEKAGVGVGAGESLSHDQLLSLAKSLLRLLDQSETESLDIGELNQLVNVEGLTVHWERSLEFLKELWEVWPGLEQQWGRASNARLRRLKAEAQIELWKLKPPTGPLIVAGTTASIPATRDLVVAIDQLPNSEVLLPGLDSLSAGHPEIWQEIGQDPAHPQYGLHELCLALNIDPANVPVWPAAQGEVRDQTLVTRVALAQWAALPSAATQPDAFPDGPPTNHKGWRQFPPNEAPDQMPTRALQALQNLELVEATDQSHEASVIALVLRNCLEQPGQTAALVTPNRDLARMVSAQMRRWGLVVDDTAGTPLDKAPAALLIQSITSIACDHAPPSAVLDLLKNPLLSDQDWAEPMAIAALEQFALRGPRPGKGLSGIHKRLIQEQDRFAQNAERYGQQIFQLNAALALVENLQQKINPLLNLKASASLLEVSTTTCAVAESLVEAPNLWRGEDGAALVKLFAELHEEADVAGVLQLPDLKTFRTFIGGLMNQATVRLPFGTHPRIGIMGTLEARLLNVDHVILGGLNEDSFPMSSEPGPWLSRRMRADFGLPPLERKIGLTAHDFIQVMGNRRVTLTRAIKDGGALTTPSRFVRRLESYLRQLQMVTGLDLPKQLRAPIDVDKPWRKWADELDRPVDRQPNSLNLRFTPAVPASRPVPKPMISRRPLSFSASDIELWRANPYGMYARKVLGLRSWEPIEAPADARLRGTLIHDAAEAFVRAKQVALAGKDSGMVLGSEATDLAFFMGQIDQAAKRLQLSAEQLALWYSRIQNAGRWLIAEDHSRRLSGLTRALVEAQGGMNLNVGDSKASVSVHARADRIESYQDGSVRIVDYKTGSPPSARDVFEGRKPQLTIEALILMNGRLEGVARGLEPSSIGLEYWQLSGGKDPGKVNDIKPNKVLEQNMGEALVEIADSFEQMIADGVTKQTPLYATAAGWPEYHQLSRLQEWSGMDPTLQSRLARPLESGGGQ